MAKYLLDLSRLQPGDVVLEAGETMLVSEAIKKATDSSYSHAMIYIGHTLIHAVKDSGVFSKNPQRVLRSSIGSFKVLRLKNPVSHSALNGICDNARVKVGSLYSVSEAGRSVLAGITKKRSRKQFCSRLVAQSYSESGIHLVDDPDYCTPEDLNRSPLLEEVVGCVRQATEDDLELASREDPNLENQRETFKWLNLARKRLMKEGADIQTINDVSQHLAINRSSDGKICKFIKSTRYLCLYNADRKLNQYRYDSEKFNARVLSSSDVCGFIVGEIKLNRIELERHESSMVISRKNYSRLRLNFTKLHVGLYRNILLEVESRLKVIRQCPCLAGGLLGEVDGYLDRISSLVR